MLKPEIIQPPNVPHNVQYQIERLLATRNAPYTGGSIPRLPQPGHNSHAENLNPLERSPHVDSHSPEKK